MLKLLHVLRHSLKQTDGSFAVSNSNFVFSSVRLPIDNPHWSDLHPSNALFPIVLTESGILIYLSLRQLRKADEPIVATDVGIKTTSRDWTFWKLLEQIFSRVSGNEK